MRRKRDIIYIGVAYTDRLISKSIIARTLTSAKRLFKEEFLIDPQEIFGPFYKKRVKIKRNAKSLKFTNITKKAIYKEWNVNAFILNEPKDSAYLIFNDRIDNQNIKPPRGTVIVPINELNFIEEK